MATEYEELKLSVTLDDQATGKLEQLKKSAGGVDDNTKKVEGLNRALVRHGETQSKNTEITAQHTDKLLQLGQALNTAHEVGLKANLTFSSVVSSAGAINNSLKTMEGGFGKVGLAVGGLAIGMVAAIAVGERFAKMLSQYAQTTVQRQRAAATIGIPTAQVRLYEQAYEEHGFTKEQAREDLTTAADKAHELRRTGFSEFRDALLKGQRGTPEFPQRQQAANEAVARLSEAARQSTPAYIRQAVAESQGAGEQRRAMLAGSRLSPEAIEEEVAKAINTMLVGLTGSARYGQIGNVGTASKEDIARQNKADKDAEDHFIAMNKIWVAYGTATDKLSESLTTVALRILGPISESFKTWADSLKPEDFQKFADVLNSAVTALAAIDWSPILTTLQATGAEFTAIAATFKEINRDLRNMLELGARVRAQARAAAGLPEEPDARRIRERDEQEAAEDLAQATAKALSGGAGAFAGPPMTQEQQDAAKKAAAQGTPETWTSTFKDFGLPDIPGALDYLFIDPFRELGKRRQGAPATFGEHWQGDQGAPTTTFGERWEGQADPAKGGRAPLTIGPTVANAIKYAGSFLGGGGAGGDGMGAALGLNDISSEQVKAMGDLTDQLKSLNDKLGQKQGATFDERFGGAATFDERFGGAATFDERFGGEGPPAPKSYPQKSSYLDFTAPMPTEPIDRASLYREARAEVTHKVENNAALTVDVNAPAGTSVGVESDFVPTTINRQMQMERAETSAYRRSNIGPV